MKKTGRSKSLVQGVLVLVLLHLSIGVAHAVCSNEVLYFLNKLSKDDAIIADILAQNKKHSTISMNSIETKDKMWRSTVKGELDGKLPKQMLSTDVSKQLTELSGLTGGLITEIIIMDEKGLNVAISHITSDYWQGDEEKHTQTFAKGRNGKHVSEVYLDESTGEHQIQVSQTIVDPATTQPIGAITIGYSINRLVGSMIGLDVNR